MDSKPLYDPTGVQDYYRECERLSWNKHVYVNCLTYYLRNSTIIRLGRIPAAYLKRNINENIFKMRHYGLGPVGTKAMTKTFQVKEILILPSKLLTRSMKLIGYIIAYSI